MLVVPGEFPETNPEVFTLAIVVLDDDHVLPDPVAVNVVNEPWQMLFAPDIVGAELTVIAPDTDVVAVPQVPDTIQ